MASSEELNKALRSSMETLSISDNQVSTLNDFCFDIELLQTLAHQGSWRSVLEKVAEARKRSLLQKPHEHLVYLCYNALALTKLRRFGDASEELDTLDDLDSVKYRYETYPDHYPGKFGSMVPFGLRWLHAELPQRLGKRQETVDRLYVLLDFVRSKLNEKESASKAIRSQTLEEYVLSPFLSASAMKDPSQDEKPLVESDLGEQSKDIDVGSFSGSSDPFRNNKSYKVESVTDFEVSQGVLVDPLRTVGEFAGNLPADGAGNSIESTVNDSADEFGDFAISNVGLNNSKCSQNEVRLDATEICIGWWRRRETILINSILSHHLSHKEFDVCMMLIKKLFSQSLSDPILLSKLGYIEMQIGDLDGARNIFSYVESMMRDDHTDRSLSVIEFKNLVNRNRALQYLVAKDYTSAIREYEECLERDNSDIVAINNKALCLMYSRDLSDSIKVLETALERVPTVALNETVIVNLCSMYELAYVNHSDIKKSLGNWIARIAPDDFDSSSIRI